MDAEALVGKYLMEGKDLPQFGVVRDADGEIHSFLASDDFPTSEEAVVALHEALQQRILAGGVATILVTPIEPTPPVFPELTVIFNLQQKDSAAFEVIMPYQVGSPGGPLLGEPTFYFMPSRRPLPGERWTQAFQPHFPA